MSSFSSDDANTKADATKAAGKVFFGGTGGLSEFGDPADAARGEQLLSCRVSLPPYPMILSGGLSSPPAPNSRSGLDD